QKDGRRIEYTAASLDELNRAINDAELMRRAINALYLVR
ncbi:gpW family head-tail joining protein, partial [Escherichia coli]